MMRRVAWLLCLLALPSIVDARLICRSYTIDMDTYLDKVSDVPMNREVSVVLNNSGDDEKSPLFKIEALDLAVGETYDSARVVVFPNFSPSNSMGAYVYEVLRAVPNDGAPTWSFYDEPNGLAWGLKGCWQPNVDYVFPSIASLTTWTGSRDSVAVASGTTFSSWVASDVLGSSRWISIHFNGVSTPAATCSWGSYESATPMMLRIYAHDALPEPTGNRRRRMYGQP